MDIGLGRKHFIFLLLALTVSIMSLFITYTHDGQGKVIFCDVGQGDGAYLRMKGGIDILIDLGPGDKILNCLGKHMPFYDKTIEFVFISHPQKDHYGGLKYIIGRYKIRTIVLSYIFPLPQELSGSIKHLDADSIQYLFAGDTIQIGEYFITFLWPSKEFSSISSKTTDPNEFSQILLINHRNVNMLFTGDITAMLLDKVMKKCLCEIDVLKVPHHGSKTGLDAEFFSLAKPTYSLISAGKKNRYKHPNPNVINLIEKSGSIIKRTDLLGDIELSF